MEKIYIPAEVITIVSTSSKGDQPKWCIEEKWVKQNTRGYDDMTEYTASLILQPSTLEPSEYVVYEPCHIKLANGQTTKGCYSLDFRGLEKQEVSLERLFEKHFESTNDILSNSTLSTAEKIEHIIKRAL